MDYQHKTREELIKELDEMRRRVHVLEKAPARQRGDYEAVREEALLTGADIARADVGEDLRKSRETIEALLNATRDLVYLLDPKGTVIIANERCAKFMGRHPETLIGVSIFELFPPEVAAMRRKRLSECVQKGLPVHFEDEHYVAHFENSFYPILGREGVERVAVYSRNITDRKRAEKALKESKEKYELLVETMNEGLGMHDETGIVTYVNDRLCEILGYTREELIGRRVTELVEESSLKTLKKQAADRRNAKTASFEIEWKGGSGRKVYTIMAPRAVFDRDGAYRGSFAVITDIAERKRTEEALKASEEKYRALFEESKDAVFIVRASGEIIDANSASAELFGGTREEIVGANILQFYWNQADRELFRNLVDRDGFVREFDWRIRRKDGVQRSCLLTSTAWKDEQGVTFGYLSIARDVTDSNRLQAQLRQAQKMESIGTLAAGIAHDFNNLLQVVLGYADMLTKGEDRPSRDFGMLEAIQKAAEEGAEMIKGLLMFSRQIESDLRPCDLNVKVKRVLKVITRTIPKMIETELQLADDLKAIKADPGQLEQVLLNLAVNARDAMPEGGRLTIETKNVTLGDEYCRTHLGTESGEYVLLSVSDTGHGMSKEVQEHIFEPFYTTKGPNEGTGLGLAMVYGIIKSHQGHIGCYSEPGIGTTFRIYFPAIVEKRERETHFSQEMPAFGTETILLVDDEQQVRRLGEMMLADSGYKVLTAVDGKDALEAYRRYTDEISLVVLDLMMPEMGGKQCLEGLLKIDPNVKVVIASGYSVNESIQDVLMAGAVDFIQKPFHAKELLRSIRKALDEA